MAGGQLVRGWRAAGIQLGSYPVRGSGLGRPDGRARTPDLPGGWLLGDGFLRVIPPCRSRFLARPSGLLSTDPLTGYRIVRYVKLEGLG